MFITVYVRFVWITNKRVSFLAIKEIRKTIWNHIRKNARIKGIRLDFINGYFDHYQCTIQLETGQTIEKMIETLNGEKTFWVNNKGFSIESFPDELPPILGTGTHDKLEWKDHCFTIEISEQGLEKGNDFTQNELDPNCKKLINNKYNEYAIQYGFKKIINT